MIKEDYEAAIYVGNLITDEVLVNSIQKTM